MSERRTKKRRTFSDIGVPSMGITEPGPSPLSNKHKRRPTNTRTARLVMYPVYGNGQLPLQGSNSMPTVPPQFLYGNIPYQPQPQYMLNPQYQQMYNAHSYVNMNVSQNFMNPQTQNISAPSIPQQPIQPVINITENGIFFTIPPQQPEVRFNFPFQRAPGQHVTLSISTPYIHVPIVLNGTHFIAQNESKDITFSIAGENNIIFCSIGFSFPVYAEIHFTDPLDLDSLLKKIIEEFGLPPDLPSDPFANRNCPITHRPIEYPGRGVACTHFQCFDLRSYIEKAYESNQWVCPVCQKDLIYENLRYDPHYLETNSTIDSMPGGNIFDAFLGSESMDGMYSNDFL